MKQKLLNKLWLRVGMIVAIMTTALSGTAWAQGDYSTDYTGNVTLSTTGGASASTCVVKIQQVGTTTVNSYDGIKAGTSSKAGAVKITVPSGTKYLHLHTAAWNNESVTLAVSPSVYSDNISLTSDSGVSGNSPFTLGSYNKASTDYYKVITFESALTENTDLTFTATNGKRFVVWGVTAEDEGSTPLADSNLALTGSTSLNFDLYNNSDAQTISFTTSSTGAVNVSESEYVTTSVSGNTITVTPVKVTPSAQTITVNQEADGTYKAGQATFTVTITDSTPFAGGDVTFVAGTDKGSTTANNSADEVTKSGVTMSSTDAAFATTEYRFYQNSTTTFSTSSGKITKIVFTNASADRPCSNLSTTVGTYTENTWTGSATSVSFTASAQARASQVVVTVTLDTKADPELAFATTEYMVAPGADFTAPTLTNPHSLTVTYSSSNEDLALVDETTGEVVIGSEEGTVIITASFAGNETYSPGSASYTISIIDNTKGTFDNPYTVADVIAGKVTREGVYVIGYIVGEFNSKTQAPRTSGFTTDANIALADEFTTSPTAALSIPVALPTNALKAAWGCVANEGSKIGTQVIVCGNGETYFSVHGIKGTTSVTPTMVPVSLNAYGYATFSSNYAVSIPADGDFTAWQITNIDSDNKITFVQVTGNVKAETGLFLKGDANDEITIEVAASGEELSGNKLVGFPNATNVADGEYYGLSGNQFVKVTAGTVKAGKALLPAGYITESNSVKPFTFVFEDDATGISDLNDSKDLKDSKVIYNLAGQMVNGKSVNGKLPKGIYIVNGKKIMVK